MSGEIPAGAGEGTLSMRDRALLLITRQRNAMLAKMETTKGKLRIETERVDALNYALRRLETRMFDDGKWWLTEVGAVRFTTEICRKCDSTRPMCDGEPCHYCQIAAPRQCKGHLEHGRPRAVPKCAACKEEPK